MNHTYGFGSTVVRINFVNDDSTSYYSLDFRLYNHPIADRWLSMMLETKKNGGEILDNGVFFGNGVNNKDQLIKRLDETVDFHNQYCEQHGYLDCQIPIKTDSPVTQGRLSKLHDYFEMYAEHPKFSVEAKSRFNLQDMNLYIHRLESCLDEKSEACHVEILSKDFQKSPLSGNDYEWFSLDNKWGQLVLTYGITGVPTINAFWSKSEPTPQNYVTNGMILSFWGDQKFDRRAELEEWLKTKNMDINNPEVALGYIPLGLIEGLENFSRDEILTNISKHTKVTGYEFLELKDSEKNTKKDRPVRELQQLSQINLGSAQWPYDQEIFYHLDLVPYIDLNVVFDSKKMFDEAFKAREYFVVHRDYDQKSGESFGKWKSLGLRSLFGDYEKTQYHTSYTFEGKAEYQNTVFSELCPETMKFLSSITDISQCERIRFMLLEPGASINVHRDSKDRDVSLAVNISLNMPEGCVFYAQLNPDGSENEHTVKLPFKDSGSVLLFNNAKYHKVVNNSMIPRIHIIFHGPTRFSDEQILKLARKQNGCENRKDLMKQLIQKKAILGEEFTKTPSLFSDWLSSGLSNDTLPKNFALAVYDHATYHEGGSSELYLKKRTAPTLFPLNYSVIQENKWDAFLKRSFEEGRDFAVLIGAGCFVTDVSNFIKELISNCHELKQRGWPAAGHIIDFNNDKHLPYFHEQFLIINLKVWNDLQQVSLGPLFDLVELPLIDADISEEKIHDDYTPLTIKASITSSGKTVRKGLLGWGSGLIIKAIEHGLGVMNLGENLRNLKVYAYPRDNLADGRTKIDSIIETKLKLAKDEVYCFNNEILSILKLPQLSPTRFISVAAGFKPFGILKQFNFDHQAKVHFVDFSPNALKYLEDLSKAHSIEEVKGAIHKQIAIGNTKKLDNTVADSLLTATVRDFFKNDEEHFLNQLSLTRNATFDEVNIVKDPEKIAEYLQGNEQFVIWVSNAFYNNQLFMLLTPEEADAQLVQLAKAIGRKTDLRIFRLANSNSFVFGKGLDFLKGILTDGAAQDAQFSKEYWHEIKF